MASADSATPSTSSQPTTSATRIKPWRSTTAWSCGSDPRSAEALAGATVDFIDLGGLQGAGFKFDNPQEKANFDDPLSQKLQEALDKEINPSIAAHGGVIELVEVKDGVAYVHMGGGCQGCGSAAATLRQGSGRPGDGTLPRDHIGGRLDEPRPGREPVLPVRGLMSPAPISQKDIFTVSATQLARRVKAGETTSTELVEAHIGLIERINPVLNVVVASRFDEARREAAAADARFAAEGPADLPAFHGVPCTIKESFALTGMPNTAGLVARRGVVSRSDAPTVARLRDAGAIPLGVTNISELCMWMESNNRVYGRSNNPYDRRRTVGGSSGGEGAAVGAGFAPFGLGSDVGGSIRVPAFFNGVFGHKPTGGLVPGSGQFPAAENEAKGLLATGPLTRRAEDLWPLLEILAGPDEGDPFCVAQKLTSPASVDVDRLRVLHVVDDGRIPVSEDLRRSQRQCADHLGSLGCEVVERRIDGFRHGFDIWAALMEEAADTSFSTLLGNGRPIGAGRELVRLAMGRSDHTFPAVALVLLETLTERLAGRNARFARLGRELRAELDEILGDDGVLLYPPYASPAPLHGRAMLPPFKFVYTCIFNAMQVPVTAVPLGLNDDGVPLGVQVAARRGNDHLTVAVALELERAFGGWVPPN